MPIRFPIAAIHAAAPNRPADYLETMFRLGRTEGQFLIFTQKNYLRALRQFQPAQYRAARKEIRALPLPDEEWPAWAKTISALSKTSDLGLGDTIARIIGPYESEAVKKWMARIGLDCGCEDSRTYLNRKFPLSSPSPRCESASNGERAGVR